MSSQCYTLWKIPTVRVTQLTSCGAPVTGSCITVVTNGIISVQMTTEYEPRQEFFQKNGDGNYCVQETNPPIMKWINITGTFCGVDPEMVSIMTGNPVVRDDSSSALATGWSDQVGAVTTSNFALEMWTRLTGTNTPCSGSEYGYVLLPWVAEGTIGDETLQNDKVDFVLTARTKVNSLWGTGPYNIDLSDSGSNAHIPLLTPILSTQHRRRLTVRMAPPTASCGCQPMFSTTPSN